MSEARDSRLALDGTRSSLASCTCPRGWDRPPRTSMSPNVVAPYSGSFVSNGGGTMIGAEELSTDDGENAGWSVINRAVSSWRRMTVLLRTDRAEGGLVNGTTRLQPDLAQSSGLGASFDILFSSELLCGHKPSPEACEKTPMFVRAQPEHSRCPMDGRIDTSEDVDFVRRESEYFLHRDGLRGLVDAIRAMRV
ncbi:hypothetical protein F4823DRAFT_557667 [Ustulina deusta]|nr:hypothetical protein F4823DRAFT_557667 [Ustulina deusta]